MLVLMFMTVISTFIYETIFRDLQSIMGKLDYRTLRENVADEIRMKILNGDMKPGDKIIEPWPGAGSTAPVGAGRHGGIFQKCRLLCKAYRHG